MNDNSIFARKKLEFFYYCVGFYTDEEWVFFEIHFGTPFSEYFWNLENLLVAANLNR